LPPEIQQWTFLKAMAYFEGAWETCPHRECRARKRCTGGPRGSFGRNRSQEARSAAGATGKHGQEARSEATGTWTSTPLCRRHASPEWWAEVDKFGKA
ncbi:MAG: hypothetical protein LJE67_03900, partial [Salaquimonas sp.]|nr:hypothetical protein [Salaquimonas sp.]